MNKKYMYTAIMAMLLPTSIFAATTADTTTSTSTNAVPVIQTTDGTTTISNAENTVPAEPEVTPEAAPTSSTVARKISTTASPETNKAMRSESDAALRDSKAIIAPEAQKFMDRLEVGVRPVTLKANYLDFRYPEISSVSPTVTEKINKTIRNYVDHLEKKTLNDNVKATNKTNVNLDYDVKADGNGILSLVFKTYSMQDKAANGVNEVKGFTFNTTTGKLLSVGDFGGVSLTQANNAIQNIPAEQKATLFENAKIEKLTGEFYALENHDVFLIIPEGTIAPMSSGTIYLPLGQLKEK